MPFKETCVCHPWLYAFSIIWVLNSAIPWLATISSPYLGERFTYLSVYTGNLRLDFRSFNLEPSQPHPVLVI